MESAILIMPLLSVLLMFSLSVLGVYTMVLEIKALKIYIRNHE